MAASRALYVSVAESVKIDLAQASNPIMVDAIAKCIRESIAPAFKRDNARFRYDTFFVACGLDAFGYPVKVASNA